MTTVDAAEHARRAHHEVAGRATAVLVRGTGRLDVAEEAVADATELALRRWPVDGVPPDPCGWLVTVARRRAIDLLRREAAGQRAVDRARRSGLAGATATPAPSLPVEPLRTPEGATSDDDELRLLFLAAHPMLSADARLTLTLRLAAGLDVTEIARLLLLAPDTVEQRLTRARRKLRAMTTPFRLPSSDELPARLATVLSTLYLLFTSGQPDSGGGRVDARVLEAMRLADHLEELLPDEPEVLGLVALMALHAARFPARLDADGRLVTLDRQDRTRWDRALVRRGVEQLGRALADGRRGGPYVLHAQLAATHAVAPSTAATDWAAVVALHDRLLEVAPSPMARLSRAVAVGERDGPAAGLAALDAVADGLADHHRLDAARGHLLARAGDSAAAAAAYGRAAAACPVEVERDHLRRRRAELDAAST